VQNAPFIDASVARRSCGSSCSPVCSRSRRTSSASLLRWPLDCTRCSGCRVRHADWWLLAFAPLFEQAGVAGAASVAVAIAIGGIIAGGLVGGPVSTLLIERRKLGTPQSSRGAAPGRSIAELDPDTAAAASTDDDDDAWPILKNRVAILVAMWAGACVAPLHQFVRCRHAVAVPGDGPDDPQALGAFGPGAAAGRDPARAGADRRDRGGKPGVPRDGPQLRSRGDERRLHRFHARHDCQCHAVMRALVERYGPAPRAFLVAPSSGRSTSTSPMR